MAFTHRYDTYMERCRWQIMGAFMGVEKPLLARQGIARSCILHDVINDT